MKLQELMTSQTIEELGNYLGPILATLKKLQQKEYEVKRQYQLVEVLSKDIANQLHKILNNENLMFCNFTDFKNWYEKTEAIFKLFEDSVGTSITRQSATGASYNLNRVISSAANQTKFVYHYVPLKKRLEQLFQIRELFQRLKSVIEEIITKSN